MPSNGTSSRNALILKIARYLNFLSKKNQEKLVSELRRLGDKTPDIDVLKLMVNNKYISPADISTLKRICIGFARAQGDSRIGALCINFGFLTQSNLDLALEEQDRLQKMGQSVMLGDLLVDAGFISERQRNLLLQKQKFEGIEVDMTAKSEVPSACPPPVELDLKEMREIREMEVVLLISNDGLKAFITKTNQFDDHFMVADLKAILEKNGIIYGLADDDSLDNFIKDPRYHNDYFETASGLDPIDGTDARIVYMFERDYLKPGELSEDGATIDFKERGDIPFVNQGDVLAEKIPPKDGKDGVNVYGDTIPRAEAMDIPFNLGKGVRLSRDELKVISETEGNPKVKPGGEISVNGAYFIEGDVDYTTGHIKFDKNVFITGSIKSGFRVEAIDVVVNTIDGGVVKAEGDVLVQNGVTESDIKAKGSIKAGFIHRSQAACLGSVTVGKEIVDTEIILEGSFHMRKGRMFSSSVCAKGGAKIYTIGSDKSKPSVVTVGSSLYLETELKNIDKVIERRQHILESKTLEKNKAESQLALVTEKLTNFDQSRKRTLAMIEELKNSGVENAGAKADIFQKSLDEADQKIWALKDEEALLATTLTKLGQDIEACSEAVKVSVKDKFDLKRLNQANPPKPVLDVEGKVLSGTKVSGRFSNLVLRENLTRSRIMEIDRTDGEGGGRKGWEMIVSSL